MDAYPLRDPKLFFATLAVDRSCRGGWNSGVPALSDEYGYMTTKTSAKYAFAVWQRRPVQNEDEPEELVANCIYWPTVTAAVQGFVKAQADKKRIFADRFSEIPLAPLMADEADLRYIDLQTLGGTGGMGTYRARYKNYIFQITATTRPDHIFTSLDDFVSHLSILDADIVRVLNLAIS